MTGKGLSPSSRRVIGAILSRALSDAVRPGGLLHSNPTVGALDRDEKRGGPGKFTLWTHQELRSLLEVADRERLSALWRLAVTTGARRGELLGLR